MDAHTKEEGIRQESMSNVFNSVDWQKVQKYRDQSQRTIMQRTWRLPGILRLHRILRIQRMCWRKPIQSLVSSLLWWSEFISMPQYSESIGTGEVWDQWVMGRSTVTLLEEGGDQTTWEYLYSGCILTQGVVTGVIKEGYLYLQAIQGVFPARSRALKDNDANKGRGAGYRQTVVNWVQEHHQQDIRQRRY